MWHFYPSWSKGAHERNPIHTPTPYILGWGASCHINLGRVVLWLWCELSYEFEASCFRASLMWGGLSWGELSLGRDVCNSPRHGLHVNSLLGFVYLKSESWNRKYTGKKKVLNICVCFDKILIVSSRTRETFWINILFTCCSTTGKNEG